MENIKNRLRINVGFIVNATVGYNRDFPFEFDKYTDDDLQLLNVSGNINIARTTQGLLATGNFTGTTSLDCVKCLGPFKMDLSWGFTELFAFKEENVTDSELLVPEDAQVDFRELFREYAILEYPIRPICSQDCQGLCPECGQNLNLKDCGHDRGPKGTLSELRDLIDKK